MQPHNPMPPETPQPQSNGYNPEPQPQPVPQPHMNEAAPTHTQQPYAPQPQAPMHNSYGPPAGAPPNPYHQSPPPVVNDIAAPAPAAPQYYSQPQAPQPTSNPYEVPPAAPSAEVVQNIPVRAHAAPPQASPSAANPITASHMPYMPEDPDEHRIEQILQDVNSSVKTPQTVTKPKKSLSSRLGFHKLAKVKKVATQPKPIAVVSLAVLTCISLAAAAYFAFHSGNTTATLRPAVKLVGTSSSASSSITAGGGSLVSPQDIDTFTKNSQTQMNGLNDAQEFNTTDLSDKILGL